MWDDPDFFVLGVDLGDSYFAHTVMIVADLDQAPETWDPYAFREEYPYSNYLQNIEIFVGNNSDWRENQSCGTYLADPSNTSNNPDYTSMYDGGLLWSFGIEAWCNLEGRYVHFIGDYSSYDDSIVTVCHLAVMGTKYVRDIAVVEEVTLYPGDTATV